MSNASGDDEELKEALREYKAASISESRAIETAMGNRHYDPSGSVIRIRDAERKVESLFGRIKEQRDALREKIIAGISYGSELEARFDTQEAELGRIREAALTPEEAGEILHFFKHKCEEGCDCLKCSFTPKLTQISRAGPPDKKEQ